jgi:hypothetical protein
VSLRGVDTRSFAIISKACLSGPLGKEIRATWGDGRELDLLDMAIGRTLGLFKQVKLMTG